MATPSTATILPDWAQWLVALGPVVTGSVTAVIALVVAGVTIQQWRVAKRKLALDIFATRYRWYSDVTAIMFKPFDAPEEATRQTFLTLYRLLDECKFLFGQDVVNRLKPVSDAAFNLTLATFAPVDPTPEKKDAERRARLDEYARLAGPLNTELPNLLAPYMRMDHKVR
jgi:hypothetical protein